MNRLAEICKINWTEIKKLIGAPKTRHAEQSISLTRVISPPKFWGNILIPTIFLLSSYSLRKHSPREMLHSKTAWFVTCEYL